MKDDHDKLKSCLICDNTGYKIIRDIETDVLKEELCECEWGQITHDYLTSLAGGSDDYNRRSTIKRIS